MGVGDGGEKSAKNVLHIIWTDPSHFLQIIANTAKASAWRDIKKHNTDVNEDVSALYSTNFWQKIGMKRGHFVTSQFHLLLFKFQFFFLFRGRNDANANSSHGMKKGNKFEIYLHQESISPTF
jgi:hypothetical protein